MGLVWARDFPAEGITTDGIVEKYDVLVIAREIDGQIKCDAISLAHEPDLKGYARNIPGSALQGSLAAKGVFNPDIVANRVLKKARVALRTAAFLPL